MKKQKTIFKTTMYNCDQKLALWDKERVKVRVKL